MYAYKVSRPEHFENVREAASENYRGLTAVVDNKLYLVIAQADGGFLLEDEEGNTLRMENFDHTARNEQDALIAASRVTEPFTPGSKIGDWTIGNLAHHEGNWYVRNGDTDQIVPIADLVQILEDESYFKDNFNSNFNVQLTSAEKKVQRTAALQKVAVTIETNLPVNGWHNGAIAYAQQLGLTGTITYPDGSTADLTDFKNFMLSMKNGMMAPGGMNSVPVTVETDMPDVFWEVWNDKEHRGGGGGNPERTASYSYELPDTPGEHFLDTMEVTADRRDYEHWNEDADRMWWEEEGKHQDYQEPYDDYNDRADVENEGAYEAASEEGWETATSVPPDALTWHYLPDTKDRGILTAWLDSYNDGRVDAGLDQLLPEEYSQLLEQSLQNYVGPQPATNYPSYGGWKKEVESSWTRVAEGEIVPGPGGIPQDIPFDPATQQSIVHAYEDGDIILEDGTTTFDPSRAYQFLIGAHEFDKAKQVKELIDRSPPSELPAAVIPPEEAQRPQEKLPEEAPLDPTGGQPQPATGAPMQPGTEVPPMPGQLQQPPRPQSSVEFFESKEALNSEQEGMLLSPYDQEREDGLGPCPVCGSRNVWWSNEGDDPNEWGQGVAFCGNCGSYLDFENGIRGNKLVPTGQKAQVRSHIKETRKDFTHSEQKALIDENLEGRARNYDKLNLKGTHYELEQESSFDDFLWQ